MAEIKSTLDIIMEKAKKFSVTEEEKRGFKRQELEGKIKGLVQKALDGFLDSERFQVEVVDLRAREKDLVDQILKEEVVARIELGANNEVLLKILENIAGPASSAVRKVLAEFEKKAEKQKESRRKRLLENFKEKGISGSAVLPNLDADLEWLRAKSEMRRELQETIRDRLKSLPPSL
jgi:formate dehydrogenase maturation protein FdhE